MESQHCTCRNEIIRRTTKKGEMSNNAQGNKLEWYGYGMIREEGYVGIRWMVMGVPCKRKKGTPEQKRLDSINRMRMDYQANRQKTKGRTGEATNPKHRSHVDTGKYAADDDLNYETVDQFFNYIINAFTRNSDITSPRNYYRYRREYTGSQTIYETFE